jgi:predicted alpha/beta hydrolase family esterase
MCCHCPALQLHSVNDHCVPVEEGRFVARALQSEYHESTDAGHFLDRRCPLALEVLLAKLGKGPGRDSDPKR